MFANVCNPVFTRKVSYVKAKRSNIEYSSVREEGTHVVHITDLGVCSRMYVYVFTYE